MRGIKLGGLVLSFSSLMQSTSGQEARLGFPEPATQFPQANRAASLGLPIRKSDALDRSNRAIIARGQVGMGQPVTGVSVTNMPVTGMPVTGVPFSGVPFSNMPVSQIPPPTVVGAPMGPSITLQREPSPIANPGQMGGPGITYGPTTSFDSGLPSLAPGSPSGGFPSVGPADCGINCPQPSLDPPLMGPGGVPRFPALNRLAACTQGRSWVGGEYLAWWTRSAQLPVLAATGPVPASTSDPVLTPVPVLSGSFGQTLHGGARFSGGWWFSDEERRGIDARIFFLFHNGSSFTATSAEYPVLGRPFYNVNTPVGPLTDVIGAPGLSNGALAVHLENSLWGGDINYRRYLLGDSCFRLDALVGYRYLHFQESLSITETGILDPSSPLISAGRAPFASATDTFKTSNDFHGGQIGLNGETRFGRWFVDARATVAFGTVFQTAVINGGQTQTFANATSAVYQGGLLALPGANIGHFSQSRFAVLPEVGLNIGYHITPNLRVFAGYNFLYLSDVLRPAGVIDTRVDASRIPNFLQNPAATLPGTPRPSPQFNTTDFWAQGINFGLEFKW